MTEYQLDSPMVFLEPYQPASYEFGTEQVMVFPRWKSQMPLRPVPATLAPILFQLPDWQSGSWTSNNQGPKAWGQFRVSGGSIYIEGSHNVASISRSSPSGYGGTYYISFSNPTANNQYAVTASAGRGQANNAVGGVAIFQYQAGGTSPPSTSGVGLHHRNTETESEPT
jgi:hypothetical protein